MSGKKPSRCDCNRASVFAKTDYLHCTVKTRRQDSKWQTPFSMFSQSSSPPREFSFVFPALIGRLFKIASGEQSRL